MTIEINLIARFRFFCASKLLSVAKSCKIIIISPHHYLYCNSCQRCPKLVTAVKPAKKKLVSAVKAADSI